MPWEKNVILVETVGVGQDEVDVMRSAHTTVIVVIPGMGDDIQAIKAGILEVGDIFLINKSDREGSDKTLNELRLMIEMDQRKHDEGLWKPPIIKVEAISDRGVDVFLEAVDRHAQYLEETAGGLKSRRSPDRVRQEMVEMIKARLFEEVMDNLIESGEFDRSVDAIVKGDLDPYSACENLVFPILGELPSET